MTTSEIPEPLLRKGERAVEVAKLILGNRAAVRDIEDQAVALMWVPIEELNQMHTLLAAAVHARQCEARRKR